MKTHSAWCPTCRWALLAGLALVLVVAAEVSAQHEVPADHEQSRTRDEFPQTAAMHFALERAIVVLRVSDAQEREIRRIHSAITAELSETLEEANARYAEGLAEITRAFEALAATDPFYQISPYSEQFETLDRDDQSRLMRYHIERQMGRTPGVGAMPPELHDKQNLLMREIGESVGVATTEAHRRFFQQVETILSDDQLVRGVVAQHAYLFGVDVHGQYAKKRSTRLVERALDVRLWLDEGIALPENAPAALVEWRATLAERGLGAQEADLQLLMQEYERGHRLLSDAQRDGDPPLAASGSQESLRWRRHQARVLERQVQRMRQLCSSVAIVLAERDPAFAAQWRDATRRVMFSQVYEMWKPLDIMSIADVAGVMEEQPQAANAIKQIAERYEIEAERVEAQLIDNLITLATAVTKSDDAQSQLQSAWIEGQDLNQRYVREVERLIEAMSSENKEKDLCSAGCRGL